MKFSWTTEPTASKDVSHGGIFGTILQMTKYSNVGADINIAKLEVPPKLLQQEYDLETFVKMFLTTSYILTTPKENCEKIIEIFKKYELNAEVIGEVIENLNTLQLNDGKGNYEVI